MLLLMLLTKCLLYIFGFNYFSIRQLSEYTMLYSSSYLSEKMKTEDPFKKTPLMRLYKEVEAYAKDKGYSLVAVTPDMKERNKAVVAKTFHGAGIVVPVQNDVGYRELPETYGKVSCFSGYQHKFSSSS